MSSSRSHASERLVSTRPRRAVRGMTDDRYDKLGQLGASTPLPDNPETAELERVANPCDAPYMVRFACPEFTSICPVTGRLISRIS